MLSEIVEKLIAIFWRTEVLIVLGIGLLRLVHRLWKLAEHKRFAKRFLAKYMETVDDDTNDSLRSTSYQWLLHNLSRIKEEMKQHGHNTGAATIDRIITQLYNLPAVLPPNLHDVRVSLEKYLGTLGNLSRKL